MTQYNPNIHHRRSIRLKGYDYTQAGFNFITICCEDRIFHFGSIDHGKMILNEFGRIAYDEWVKLPERFSNIDKNRARINRACALGDIVGAYKYLVAN